MAVNKCLSCWKGEGASGGAAPGGMAQKAEKSAENVDFKFKKIDLLLSTIFKLLK
jgi:hypothetical protein